MFRVTSSGRKQHFPLAAYNCVKKARAQELALMLVEKDAEIRGLRSQLHEKVMELEPLNLKHHKTEEHIRRRKRKVGIVCSLISYIQHDL